MKIFVTNLGKYNEGYLIGEWLSLPTSQEEIKDCLKRIGINEEYEEYFITDYENSFIKIEEYSTISQLNEIAEAYEELNDIEKELLDYFMNQENMSIDEAIESIDEGNYMYYYGVFDEYDLGVRIADDFYDIPKDLENHINFDSIGRESVYSGWNIYNGLAICLC